MRRASEVSEQGGFRWFLVCVLSACLVGMLIRLSLAPAKIEKFIREKIEESPLRENLVFASAEISLADGWMPDIAVILHRLEWRTQTGCVVDVSPIRAQKMRIPLRMTSLLGGQPSAGVVKIDDLSVDLDDLKRECKHPAKNGWQPATTIEKAVAVPPAGANVPATVELWSESEHQRIAAMLSGVRVTRGEVYFESRMKSVMLEDLSAMWRGDGLEVSTTLKFPPSTVFGENLPSFNVNGLVRRREIQAEIRAELSEGTLEANAQMTPVLAAGGVKELEADLKLVVSDLPLSVVTPLLTKSGIVAGAFHPKFVWLDCNAEVHGIFSRLLVENPVSLSECAMSGQAGRLSLDTATRLPNGKWKPFEVSAEKIEIARVLDSFELQGPNGVFANFGFLSGKLKFESPELISVAGNLNGSVLRFAGGEGTAVQSVSIDKLSANLQNHRWKVELAEFHPEGGTADLKVLADLDQAGRDATVEVKLGGLKLSPRVEKVIFTGPVENISGSVKLAMGLLSPEGKTTLSKLKSSIVITGLRGTELTADEIKLESQLSQSVIEVNAKTARIEVLKSGKLFKLLQPSLLGSAGESLPAGDRLVLGKVAIRGHFLESGFQWSQASANVGPLVTLASKGIVFRDHAIESELEAHYPLASHLKWNISGTWMKPKFASGSVELENLFARAGLPRESVEGVVPLRLLGLPKDTAESSKP
ncbi:hypothetical protein BH10BDE1_BH10BDE1_10940 [soil metagenome]